MEKLRTAFGQLKKYPIILLFFLFLGTYSLADGLAPQREFSDFENRPLAQFPAFSVEALIQNQWTMEFNEYTKDQLLGRDRWISAHSLLESAQGKLENNGVWYAEDGYQIMKQERLTSQEETRIPINTKAVAELAARHPGKVTVMIVPSPANILSGKLRFAPPQLDENAILDEMYASFAAAGATVIDLRETLEANQNEYIFYRTDHHWTTTGGARLAYEAYCATQGRAAPLPPEGSLQQRNDFLGTNYAKSKKFGTEPDILFWYALPNTLTVYKPQSDGGIAQEPGPVMDVARFDAYDKYAAFLRGNNGYSVLEGNGEGRVLLIKDSYGNSFAPYLTQSHAQIGIIDLRAWVYPVDDTIAQEGYEEILVLYSFDTFIADGYANRMQDALQTRP